MLLSTLLAACRPSPQSNRKQSLRLPHPFAAWKLNGSDLLHIGIVSDRKSANGTPLIIHNIGDGTQEGDILFRHAVIGHYRPVRNDL